MFIRTKNIKGHPYAYLVENTWKRESSRQKVSKYLGRVHILAETGKTEAIKLDGLSYEESIKALMGAQLRSLGFVEKDNVLKHASLVFDSATMTLKDSSSTKSQVVKSNDGFVCDHTLAELIAMKNTGNEQEVWLCLAKACVAAGLDIDNEQFVELYELLGERKIDTH